MEKQEQHDLLIRLDVGQQNLVEAVGEIKEAIKEIKEASGSKPCDANTTRIGSLEWIVRGSVLASIAAMARAFWPTGG